MYVSLRLPTTTVFIFPSLRQIIFASHIVNSRDLNIKTTGIELLFSFSFFWRQKASCLCQWFLTKMSLPASQLQVSTANHPNILYFCLSLLSIFNCPIWRENSIKDKKFNFQSVDLIFLWINVHTKFAMKYNSIISIYWSIQI